MAGELHVQRPVGLGDGVDALLHALRQVHGPTRVFLGVGALVQPLPRTQGDLVLVVGTNDAQLAVELLREKTTDGVVRPIWPCGSTEYTRTLHAAVNACVNLQRVELLHLDVSALQRGAGICGSDR